MEIKSVGSTRVANDKSGLRYLRTAMQRSVPEALIWRLAKGLVPATAFFAAVFLLFLVSIRSAQAAVTAPALYTSNCASCHGSTPSMPQLNAAGRLSYFNHVISSNFGGAMTTYGGPLSTAQRQELVDYFQDVLEDSIGSQVVTVNYHGTTGDIDLRLDTTTSGTDVRYSSVSYSGISGGTVANGTPIGPYTGYSTPNLYRSTARYTHTANSCAAGSFTAQASGTPGTSSARTFSISVIHPAAPTASSPATVNTSFGSATPIAITLGGGPAASIVVTSPPAHGTLQTNGTSSFTYTSATNAYQPSTSFAYKAVGPCGEESSPVTVTVNISPPLTPDRTVSVPYNPGGASATSIALGATYGSLPITGISIVGPATRGTAAVSGTSVNYLPNSGNLTQDSFQYTANWGGTTLSGQGTVTINITPPGAPTYNPMNVSVPYNAGGASATSIDLSGFFTSPVSNIAIESAPGSGTATVSGATSINYTPAVGNLALTTMQIRAYAPPGSPAGASSVATVSISVTPPGAPSIQAKAISTPFGTPVTFSLLPITGSYNTIVLGARSQGGNAVLSGTDVTYTPSNSFAGGTETFTYTVTAPGGASSTQTVTATVIALPVATNASITVPFNTAATFDLPVTGFTQVNVTTPSHGTVSTPAANSASITYTPTAGYTGPDSFTYTATGPGGTSAPATVNVTVSTLPATASNTTMSVALNSSVTLDLAPFITGSGIIGVSVPTNPAHGTVIVNGTRVTYKPASNFSGTDSFTYSAYGNHSSSASAPATVTVTVTGREDPTKDAVVTAMLASQVQTARRFSQAQVSNFQTRMESLHRSRSDSSSGRKDKTAPSYNGKSPTGNFAAGAANYAGRGGMPSAPSRHQPSGAAYKPAASLASDPVGSSSNAGQMPSGDALTAALSAMTTGGGDGSESQTVAAVGKALGFAASALQNKSFNLSASSDGTDGGSSLSEGTNVWIGGGVRFGTRNKDSRDRVKFSTDGVSFGVDRRFSDDLVLGVGLGYASDESTIGTDGSNSESTGYTLAAYGSYQPAENIYLDGMLGYGRLRYDTERYIEAVDAFAQSKRSGDYLFASLTAAYEHRSDGLLLSPYGRLDLVEHRLDATTEKGGGTSSLHYYSQKIPGMSFAAGLRAETAHETSFGWATPRLRVELKHDFKGEQEASVSYADQIGGTKYTIQPNENERDSVVLGIGSDFIYRNGITLSFDYQTERVPGEDIIQAVNFKLTKNLDGRNSAPGLLGTSFLGRDALGIKVDAAYLYDSNISRSSLVEERLADRSYSLNFSKTKLVPLGEFTRMFLHGFAGGEQFKIYDGLNKLYLGGQAELQYRSSGDFGTPIYSAFINGTSENFESSLRDGYRYSVGLSVRKAMTDRIDLFGALANNFRDARSRVFTTKDYSARVNLDFALDSGSSLYFGSEYRWGDITSSGTPSLANVDIAEWLVQDDVFTEAGYSTYRFDGTTVMWTLGYSHPLGAKDTLDFSLRRIRSRADDTPDYIGATNSRYTSNQFSILYLTSF